MTTTFTPLQSFGGGMLIGLAATFLMIFFGRIAGVTGIVSGMLPPVARDWPWRAAFLAGMLAAPIVTFAAGGTGVTIDVAARPLTLLASGILVGVGVYYGNGCPSGHGICGLARFSPRSLGAVATFMTTAAATVFVVRHVIGG